MEQVYANAFNAWMDEYINHPEKFAAKEEAALKHLSERLGGEEHTYGQRAAATFMEYMNNPAA